MRDQPKRRGHGEGAIYQRRDGRWVGAVRLENGKRRSYYGHTQQAVQAKLRAAHRALDDGLELGSGRQKLGAFLTRWLRDVAEPTVRPSTYSRYRELMERHVIPELGHRPLVRLSPQELSELYKTKLKAGLAPRTVGHIHRVLHRALRDALRWGLVARNVCTAVDPPKVARQEMHVLTPEQTRGLLAAAAGNPLEALYVLAVTTGLRQGEILALKWSDVDLDTGRLSVRRTVRRVPRQGVVEGEPKSARSRRSVHLTTTAITALKDHRARQAQQRLRAVVWDDHDLVFANEIGRHIEPANLLRRSFWPLRERAGVPAVRFHDLRHTAATLMLVQGIHVKVVSEMLGHSSVSLTLDVYSHVLPSLQSEAAAKMEALLAI